MTKQERVQMLNDIFKEMLGQTYERSLDDDSGCSMGRNNGVWLSPQLITQIVDVVIDEFSLIGE